MPILMKDAAAHVADAILVAAIADLSAQIKAGEHPRSVTVQQVLMRDLAGLVVDDLVARAAKAPSQVNRGFRAIVHHGIVPPLDLAVLRVTFDYTWPETFQGWPT